MEEVGRSSVKLGLGRTARWDPAGVPVYGYRHVPGEPPVGVVSLRDAGAALPQHRHAHDFLVLCLVERGGCRVRVGGRELAPSSGDLLVVGPGQVVDPRPFNGAEIAVRAIHFSREVITAAPGAFRSWQANPMLFAFAAGLPDGVQQLAVPAGERAVVSSRFDAVEQELARRRDGFHDAVLAHLTLLLLDVARLAADLAASPTLHGDPLLTAVFEVIEAGYARPLSLRDVAAAVGVSAGHLTTVVGRKTGRTVQAWIDERRMAEARTLLATTVLPVEAVAARVGFTDPGYFARRFRRSHGVAPRQWRNGNQPASSTSRSLRANASGWPG